MNTPLLVLMFALGAFASDSNSQKDYQLSSEHQKLLNSVKKDLEGLGVPEAIQVFRDNSVGLVQYVHGSDWYIQEMPPKDLEEILQLVVLTKLNGNLGYGKIPEEDLPEYLKPLLQGSVEEKRAFIRDMPRVKYENSPEIPPQPRPVAGGSFNPLSSEHQGMLRSAIDSIKRISDQPEELEKLHNELFKFAGKYARGNGVHMKYMSSDDIVKIFQFVVLQNHLSKKEIDFEELSIYLAHYFLHCSGDERLGWLRNNL